MFSLECLSKLFEQARNGNAQARDQLVLDNTGLVWSVVKKYRGRGYEQEDLFQIGCIGLIKGIDNFDIRQLIVLIRHLAFVFQLMQCQ